MPARALLIDVRLVDGRYHGIRDKDRGTRDWPPAPFRLFQALVAGAYGGRFGTEPDEEKDAALLWLERLGPPLIAAPAKRNLRATNYFVPNNDLDAVGGDPRRVSEIRVGKVVRPVLFDADVPILYAWHFEDGDAEARHICTLAERLHTLGHGMDAAYAHAGICGWHEAEARLEESGCAIARPAGSGRPGDDAACPTDGSLSSLKARYAASGERFQTEGKGRRSKTLFRQPPKPASRTIIYDRPPARLLFELCPVEGTERFHPAAQTLAADLVKAVRDVAVARLKAELPEEHPEIDRLVTGDQAGAADIACRVRFISLPSIGMDYTSPAIRRVLVEIPPDCPFNKERLSWALSGQSLSLVEPETGEILHESILTPAEDRGMLRHYGIEGSDHHRYARRWRTVTPAVLPEQPKRRGRIKGSERVEDGSLAAVAVATALRHAGYDPRDVDIRVQAEPFRRMGERAKRFRPHDTDMRRRFTGRLRHVEITFPQPVTGPLTIGDGRFVGLGLMAPVPDAAPLLHIFAIDLETAPSASAAEAIARALRRAVMARAEAEWRALGRREALPTFFTGHEPDGRPKRSGRHEHLFFLADDCNGDGRLDRLAVIAPALADRSKEPDTKKRRETERQMRRDLRLLDRALSGLEHVKAGRNGRLRLSRSSAPLRNDDALFGQSRLWVSRTRYRPTRHARRIPEDEAIRQDILEECARRGLPRPEIEVLRDTTGPRGGLSARAQLRFAKPVIGPLLLGRGSHFGAGLFEADD